HVSLERVLRPTMLRLCKADFKLYLHATAQRFLHFGDTVGVQHEVAYCDLLSIGHDTCPVSQRAGRLASRAEFCGGHDFYANHPDTETLRFAIDVVAVTGRQRQHNKLYG